MFTAFYEEMYKHIFEGVNLVVPQVHPGTNMEIYSTLGKILSHAYLVCGILPTRIAFPCLKSMLIPQSDVGCMTDEMLVDCFIDSINCHESKIVREALEFGRRNEDFPDNISS